MKLCNCKAKGKIGTPNQKGVLPLPPHQLWNLFFPCFRRVFFFYLLDIFLRINYFLKIFKLYDKLNFFLNLMICYIYYLKIFKLYIQLLRRTKK